MSLQDILSYSSFAIGVFGIIIALFQGFEKKKLRQYVYSQAWHVFSMANISFGANQNALKAYREIYQDNINPTVLEYLAKCEAFNISLFVESIRQIHLSEPKFNLETITQWAMQGKISKEHMPYFIRMMPMDQTSLLSLMWNSFALRIKQKCIASINPQQNKENTQNNGNNV